jgi:putative methyltransferase (TIGR04325 family)
MKRLVHDWLPPALFRQVRRVYNGAVRFEGEFSNWEDAAARCTGYDSKDILDKVLAATLKVNRGEAAFERDSVLFDEIEYSWPVLSGLMCAAARAGGRINVLDFGGALGSGFFQNRKFLNLLPDVRWNIVEQFNFVEAGRQYIQDNKLCFYKSIAECLAENQVNVVLLSSVLQYLPTPYTVLEELLAISADTLILDRTSFLVSGHDEIIRLQHVPETIYKATYPCHLLDESKLRQFISDRGYTLIEAFGSLDEFDPKAFWRGHIYQTI